MYMCVTQAEVQEMAACQACDTPGMVLSLDWQITGGSPGGGHQPSVRLSVIDLAVHAPERQCVCCTGGPDGSTQQPSIIATSSSSGTLSVVRVSCCVHNLLARWVMVPAAATCC
jgi:hypothetical protein